MQVRARVAIYLVKAKRRVTFAEGIINLFVSDVQSDGGGRSGVYLAIDANMELAEEEDAFDVFGYLKKLRQSRRGLIENLVQQLLLNIVKAISCKMKVFVTVKIFNITRGILLFNKAPSETFIDTNKFDH